MAGRLVKRCACLLREAAHLAPAGPPAGRLSLARVARKTLTSSATSPSSHFPVSSSQPLEKEQSIPPYPERQEVDELIRKATGPEELLELLGGGHGLQQDQAALVVIRLSRLLSERPEDKAWVVQDARFQQLLQLVSSQITTVWHGTLVKLLRSLYTLALPATSKELLSVEQEVRWRMRRLKFKHLAFLAESSRMYCLDLVEQFGPEELQRVLVALAAQNRRSLPLLRAISYHLVQKPFPLNKGVLLDLAYAYGKLGFHQTQVFQRLAADLLPHVPSLTPGEVARCAKSFAFLKWLSLPLFEAFAQHVLSRAQSVAVSDLCNVLLAFARLNFRPEQEEAFFSLVHEKLGSQLADLDPALQVDVLWALCVLQQARASELQAVLRPELHTQFLGDRSPRGQSTFQKLLHINATARLEHPEYAGPLLPASALDPGPPGPERKVTPLQKELQETLKGLLGGADRGRFSVATQYGWVLDAEVLLDAEGQFLPLRDFVAPHLSPPSDGQLPPPTAKRLAFLRWEFSSFASRSKDLLGRFVLARRHVLAAGFLVVDVPYYEWLELRSEWQKAAYLKDKMRKSVAEELAK
ncbi:PREDICTED: protein TBRG4 [Myotis davidii]|uniref:FAST kinase domain-containing protein 4 n=1 Tax=Myotis davidii TaxID=225400 RepID=L5LHQ4_MYODS|nr:PREDICTED: protein TBRG4 [Myotis davidii]ELK25178.1 Protein TBRG4 [Myotis davidii]